MNYSLHSLIIFEKIGAATADGGRPKGFTMDTQPRSGLRRYHVGTAPHRPPSGSGMYQRPSLELAGDGTKARVLESEKNHYAEESLR